MMTYTKDFDFVGRKFVCGKNPLVYTITGATVRTLRVEWIGSLDELKQTYDESIDSFLVHLNDGSWKLLGEINNEYEIY